ncbi:uncharacterized protein FOMMEDRAFT_18850 [Fomitiporia mediterranea MF3/22]|uniref:uncharacterized protein n=1 Tax=Fomitiporia mediterranea (strain MF3/22) TaxID=694068 RepID=UPI000440886A|nr:uncharacterized protein FOMMEDRAFT_18850 [Fomitiporia mediterranea MF3/22]EJD05244.1 hypothetical protein FOMMEDRAFT_18850 [Fomitiporia mediterranea MF3/22]
MSTIFSGSLQVKKKGDLQEIAQALGIDDRGTREVLQERIKKHLDDNSGELEGDPAFAGLYTTRGGRRQRSVQPTHTSSTYVAEAPKFTPIAEERAMTPPPSTTIAESRVSLSPMALASPARRSPRNIPLPSSPAKSVVEEVKEQPVPQAALGVQRNFVGNVLQKVAFTRAYLSNSRNIFVLSTALEFLAILYNIHVNSVFPIPPIYTSSQPALSATALATMYWGIPTIVLPAIIGYLVSFSSPSPAPPHSPPSREQWQFDVLSAAIIRVAANFVNVFPKMVFVEKRDVEVARSLDVLGVKWRVVSSGVVLAFAFAEAVVRRG